MHIPLCGIFAPNSGYIARYAPFIRDKSPTNCDAQLTEMNFKTRSVPAYNPMGASRIVSAKKPAKTYCAVSNKEQPATTQGSHHA
ncbi:DUF6783 domain-containing protein [uncultured Robinsoniella sp.]|uniref:DUF6783 domain-containing protein n=1 Tax=uncultured Robinsoniella sp. TaxID=904190 RepID=UPI00374F2B94